MGSGFSFTTSSKLWQYQREKNEGSEETVCLPPYTKEPPGLFAHPVLWGLGPLNKNNYTY